MTHQTRPWSADTAAARLEDAFARVDAAAEGTAHVFTGLFRDLARRDVAALPEKPDGPLKGALVSIKDLLDVEAYPTRAGSPALLDADPAVCDSDVALRLRQAGAILVGHTNMTELAYSGIGANPHFGTPDNALYPGHAPGGSSSGAAVSVALGLADIAIGSDTSGSIRIPAAFNGLVGFKPTQASVSRKGCVPLSVDVDTLGPLARTVADCAATWRVLSGDTREPEPDAAPVLVVPENFGRSELHPAVARGFAAAVARLEAAGHRVVFESLPSLDLYARLQPWHFAAVEARTRFDHLIAAHGDIMDPRVIARMRRAEALSAMDYRHTLDLRAAFVEAIGADLGDRYLLTPTVATLPPAMADLAEDDDYHRINVLCLRNTTLANMADGCAITLPVREGGETSGAMIMARAGRDPELLALAADVEAIVAG